MAKILIPGYQCERCQHTWTPRNSQETPRVCPKCKSPYWNSPVKRQWAKDKAASQAAAS